MKIDNVEKYLPLIKNIASRYSELPIPFDDLVQEGYIGLLEAAKRFDKKKKTKFTTYATYWIKKKILAALDREKIDTTTSIKDSKNVAAKEQKIPKKEIEFPSGFPQTEKKILQLLFEKEYTLSEIGEILNLDREKVRRLKELGKRRLKNYYNKNRGEYNSIFPENIL